MRNSIEKTFDNIYKTNAWNGKESVSGTGSDTLQTKVIISELPKIFKEYNIATMLDIPCGDFYWMNTVDLNGVQYTGADIIGNIIADNNKKYKTTSIGFNKLNLLADDLPTVDLIFCRDCLVHFSHEDIFLALHNIHRSNSKYLMTTTFENRITNVQIQTGEWRPINLKIAPFNLPNPIKVLNEQCTEFGGIFQDKSLGLWKIADLHLPTTA